MDQIYKNFVKETFNSNGKLIGIEFNYPENYNFGFDVVDELAKRYPEQRALLWLSADKEEKVFTFSDISKLSNKAANLFVSKGIKKGDVVMLIVKRHYQFWPIIVALHKIGAIVVPATFLLTEKDLIYRYDTSGTKAVICTGDGDVSNAVEAAKEKCKSVKLLFSVNSEDKDGWINFDKEFESQSDVFERPVGDAATRADEISIMYFTSGTTGYPRIAAHSHTYSIGHIITAVHWHNVKRNGLHFTISDTGWGKSVWGKLYGQWMAECCVFAYDFEKFDANDILSVMEKYRITTFCAPPTMYRFMIKEDMKSYDLSSITYLTTAGEALNPEVFRQVKEATGIEIMEGFGQTETTLTIGNLANSRSVVTGSMGKPSPQYNTILVDNDGNEVDPGIVGEIAIDTSKGAPVGMFLGYYKDEELTKRVWSNNLYRTGDMAWRDENGNFWFVGRADDLIKSSGYRISPFEIESVLMEHPSVTECAVTGVPDEIRGQIIKATVVLSPRYSPSDALADELKTFVKRLTAPYKYPRVIEFVKELPKTISGKVRRVEIRAKDTPSALPVSEEKTLFEKLDIKNFSFILPLIQLFKDSVNEPKLDEEHIKAIKDAVVNGDIEFFTATQGGQIVGICSVSYLFTTYVSDKVGIFDDFFILEEHRGKGIARSLVNYVFSLAREKGIKSLWVSSEKHREMYRGLGFNRNLRGLLVWNS